MGRHDHPVFAAVYDFMSAQAERKHFARHRRTLLGQATGRVLELGAGTGANFAHYATRATIIATEPDAHMLRRARVRATMAPARIAFVQAAAEALPFGDGVFDTAVATLVLCSVASPLRALQEIRRVLRPGGRLLFYEHIRAASPGWQRFQDLITPAWRRIGAGCCPNRDTLGTMRQAGFVVDMVEHLTFGPHPIRPQVKGIASVPPCVRP